MIEGRKILAAIPAFIKRLLVGNKIEVDNQVLNLNSQLLLKVFYRIMGDKICNLTPQEARSMINRVVNLFHNKKKLNRMCDIKNDILYCNDTEIPIRIYRPHNTSKIIPTLLYYHGGGFVVGTLDMYDYLCATFSSQSTIQVISVDYRLAPENKFPIPPLDCIAAYNELYDNAKQYNIDINQLAVAGDSAGGNLGTIVASHAVKSNKNPKFQLLIYPVVRDVESPSFELFKEGFLLETDDMYWFANHYVSEDQNRKDPLLSPMYLENTDQMPTSIIVIAGFDPLRDEGFDYAKKLKDQGVKVIMQVHDDQFHGFYHMNDALPEASIAVNRTCESIKKLFDNSSI
mgnify:CR=1 FL=1